MPVNDLFLRAARRERTERAPVWLMRQAGRFDPEYRRLKDQADMPLEEMFRTPDLAAEITLLPQRFGVDAIIFFQDILTPLAPMGAQFLFRPGPVLADPVRSASDVAALTRFDPTCGLDHVPVILKRVRDQLEGALPLLGFAGAPLTLAFFLIEGQSPGTDPQCARAMMKDDRALFHALLSHLADATADYLLMQIEAGVDAVQLFESTADLLSRSEYEEFARPYQVQILSRISGRVPTILFAKDPPAVDLMADTGADVLSLSSRVDLADAKRRYGDRVALQGNVDNRLLAEGSFEDIDTAVTRCVNAGGCEGHILNLGHGVRQDTPPENVRRLIQTARVASRKLRNVAAAEA